MSLKKIFIINLVLGFLVSLAHVPLIAFKLFGASGFESVELRYILPLVPFELVLLIGVIIALAGSDELKPKILIIHAVILGILSAVIVGMLFWYIVIGFSGGNFSWSAGFGAALVDYSVHVCKRAFYQGDNRLMANACWYSAGVVFF